MTTIDEKLSIYEVLHKIQKSIIVPKEKYNSHGKFHYRTCEQIIDGAKKVMPEGATLLLADEPFFLEGRFYIKATTTFSFKGDSISCSGYAREPENQTGMNASQLTGSASSYARKYALSGLLALDNNTDIDALDNGNHLDEKDKTKQDDFIEIDQFENIVSLIDETKSDAAKMCEYLGIEAIKYIPKSKYDSVISLLERKKKEGQQ